MDDYKELFKQALGGLRENMDNGNLLEQHLERIAELAKELEKAVGDGLQWEDVLSFAKLVKPLLQLANEVEEQLDEDEKQAFVVDAMWLVYKVYDGGLSGNENRIDIPFLFGPFERKVEQVVVRMIAEFATRAVFKEL